MNDTYLFVIGTSVNKYGFE